MSAQKKKTPEGVFFFMMLSANRQLREKMGKN